MGCSMPNWENGCIQLGKRASCVALRMPRLVSAAPQPVGHKLETEQESIDAKQLLQLLI